MAKKKAHFVLLKVGPDSHLDAGAKPNPEGSGQDVALVLLAKIDFKECGSAKKQNTKGWVVVLEKNLLVSSRCIFHSFR
jgi:hypothetical protein